ncbi:MAG: alpha/beta hydrolase [Novosphingobium sp.]
MRRGAARSRLLGWLGRIGLGLLAALALLAGLAWWAVESDAAALLDRIDASFARDRPARLAVATRYGEDPAQKLELFAPGGSPPRGRGFPLVVFFHGGGWHAGHPHDYQFVARTLADKGYATALVGYRLNRAGRYPAMLEDSAAGIGWLARHAGKHRIDASRMVLTGHSAGAYNAVMLALDRRWLEREGLPDGIVAGAVGLAGPYDFFPFKRASSRNAMGHWPRPAETQPVTFARRDSPPLLLVAGTDDTLVRPRNARALAKAMRAAGGPVTLVWLDGAGHDRLVITLARPFDLDERVTEALFAFLARVLPTDRASAPVQPGPG